MKQVFELGQLVTVRFNSREKIPNIGAKKYDGTCHRIASKTNYLTYPPLYELEGCVSDQGVPYTFLEGDFEVTR